MKEQSEIEKKMSQRSSYRIKTKEGGSQNLQNKQGLKILYAKQLTSMPDFSTEATRNSEN